MRRFWLYRDTDETGVSGTGLVAEGVAFGSGRVAMTWRTKHTSMAVYDDMDTVAAIHGHDGKTRVIWVDPLRDPRRVHGEEYGKVARDFAGEVIEEGALILPLTLMDFEREPYYVSRTEVRDGRWMVSAIGWPECGYGLGADYADSMRIVASAAA